MDRILVVDDDPRTRQMLQRYLTGEGFAVLQAGTLREARETLSQGAVALILLDLKLGPDDGLDLAREIQQSGKRVPIIILSTRDDVVDKVVGLELGAEDYLTKPYHLRELLARIRVVLRRQDGRENESRQPAAPGQQEGVVRFGRWRLDRESRRLLDGDGMDAGLTVFEYRLLETLILQPQRVLSREHLLDRIGGRDWTPFDRAIDTHISRLRSKIEEDPGRPVFIQTVRGEGYMFVGRIAHAET
ncbi:response regulator transcription factor [Pseudokordiimonas caeni]|uniref:response regulator transcription factor n=1 Tax=Pseudokordiimonas caeni TaxID=2997908 RepID=UPI00281220E4|nr:response regulator transcription factor [Pseudokordiimonas caeni]